MTFMQEIIKKEPVEQWRFLKMLAEALKKIHDQGKIHGDLSPAHIIYLAPAINLIESSFSVLIGATRVACQKKYLHWPPECLESGIADPSYDVYSFAQFILETLALETFPAPIKKWMTDACAATPLARPSLDRLIFYFNWFIEHVDILFVLDKLNLAIFSSETEKDKAFFLARLRVELLHDDPFLLREWLLKQSPSEWRQDRRIQKLIEAIFKHTHFFEYHTSQRTRRNSEFELDGERYCAGPALGHGGTSVVRAFTAARSAKSLVVFSPSGPTVLPPARTLQRQVFPGSPFFEHRELGTWRQVGEFYSGESLLAIVEKIPSRDEGSAGKIIYAVARALYDLHQQGIVHGDLGPANVLVEKIDDSYVAHLIDIDDAYARKMGESAASRVSQSYLAPEVVPTLGIAPALANPSQDVFSLAWSIDEYFLKFFPSGHPIREWTRNSLGHANFRRPLAELIAILGEPVPVLKATCAIQ